MLHSYLNSKLRSLVTPDASLPASSRAPFALGAARPCASPRRLDARLRAGLACALVSLTLCTLWTSATALTLAQSVRLDSEVERHDSDTGLPQNSVTALLEDQAGYLWIGTYGGLSRHDGQQFRVYGSVDGSGPPSDRITALLQDAQGRIWIGTENAGVGRLEADGRFLRAAHCAPLCLVRQLLRGPDDQILATSEQGVYRVADDLQVSLWPSVLQPAPHLAAPDGRGTLYLANRTQIEWVNARGSVVLPPLPGNQPVDQLMVAQDQLWVATAQALYHLDAQERWRTLEHHPLPNVYRAGDTPSGALWFSTYQEGLWLRPDTQTPLQHLPLPAGVRSPLLLEDRYGTRWVGTDGHGLLRLYPPQVGGLGGPGTDWAAPTMAVLGSADGAVWIGGFCSGLWRYQDAQLTSVALPDDGDGCVWTLAAAGHADVLVTYARGEIARVTPQGEVIQRWQLADEPRIRALYLDAQEALWVGGSRGVYRAAAGRPLVPVPELGQTEIATLVPASAGGLWVAGKAGVQRWLDGQVQASIDLGLNGAPAFVRSVHEDASGVLWIGTYGHGLYRVQQDQRHHYSTRNGLAEDVVSCVREDAQGRLWLSGNRGLSKLARRDREQPDTVRPTLYTRAQGMPIAETNGGGGAACTTDQQGRIWFPLISGAAVVDPSRIAAPTERAGPAVDIEAVWVNGVEQDWRTGVRLGTAPAHLRVRYTAPGLDPAAALAFRYRLGDSAWIDSGSARELHLSALPFGEVHLELAARYGHGAWTATPTRLAMSHPAPWLQRGWVQLGAVLSVLTLVVLASWARLRALRRRARWLDQQVAQRTLELAGANEQLQALAVTDALTGVGNRRSFDGQLEAACGSGQALAVVLFDVDGFKAYNDHYGHPAGDACLQRIAAVTAAALQERSTAASDGSGTWPLARIGGEEFALVLLDTSLVKALHLAEALRHAVEMANLTHPRQAQVTISVGVAHAEPLIQATGASLLRAADAALYQAKQTGRNRVQWRALGATDTPVRNEVDPA